ncbi:hypothetical protein GA0115240_164011, partial [Streptomyces sp. DvalAA-14]
PLPGTEDAAAPDAYEPDAYEPDGYEQNPYEPAHSGYDPYAVPAGTEPGYGYPEQGYQDPNYVHGAESGQQWDGQYPPVPAPAPAPGTYEEQQAAYGEGYGYIPAQPGYDPYAPAPEDPAAYGVPQQGYGPEYGEQQGYGEEQGYADPAAYPDPGAYYPEGDPRRDGSDHQ